jgi:hypothetical protein
MKQTKKNKPFNLLKDIDIFKVPLKSYFHRHDQVTDKISENSLFGSTFGGLMSIIFITLVIMYSLVLIIQMYSGEQDNIKQMLVTNHMIDESN